MLPSLDVLLAGIQAHAFVRADYYAALACDDALDQRDLPGRFDSDWALVYEATRARWNDVSTEVRFQSDAIRREAFLIVSNATGQHEIASYVSDDFDLLSRCQVLGIVHPLSEYLWKAYQSGKFPVPTVYEAQQSNEFGAGCSD